MHSHQRGGQVEGRWLQVVDIPIHMRVSTEKVPTNTPTIVLVHGVGVSSRYMVPLMRCLAPHYKVYAPDLPGFGKSAKPSKVLNIAELADALHEWMQAVPLEKAVLIGNSIGCQIIVAFALKHPERLSRAILYSPAIDPGMGGLLHHMVRLPLALPYERLSLAFTLAREYWQAGPRRVQRTFHYAQRQPIEEQLPLIQIPTLVMRGAHDPIVSQQWVETMVQLLPQGQLKVIPGVAHAMNYSAPLEFMGMIRTFLDADIVSTQQIIKR